MLPQNSSWADHEIISIGLDLVDRTRFDAVFKGAPDSFRAHVFTVSEWSECFGGSRGTAALAMRFAAKEACLKALGTGWAGGLALNQVCCSGRAPNLEIDLEGPAAQLADKLGVRAIHVSFAETDDATAVMIVLTK